MAQEQPKPRRLWRVVAEGIKAKFSRNKVDAPAVSQAGSPMGGASIAGGEVWATEDLRKHILSLLEPFDLRRVITLDRQTCEDVIEIRNKHMNLKIFQAVCRSTISERRPMYFSAVTTLDIRRAARDRFVHPGWRSGRLPYLSKEWTSLLLSLPALRRATFEDLILQRLFGTSSTRPNFKATRVITQPLRSSIKTRVTLANPWLPRLDIIVEPAIIVELYSAYLRGVNPSRVRIRSTVPNVISKMFAQIARSRDLFAHSIESLTVGAPYPLAAFSIFYDNMTNPSRPAPPAHLRLDCSHYDIHALESFCKTASPRLRKFELGPVHGSIPTVTFQQLMFDFDWSALGNLQTLKISVLASTFEDWLEACQDYALRADDSASYSHLRDIIVVFHGWQLVGQGRDLDHKLAKQRLTDRIVNQVSSPQFLRRFKNLFGSTVRISFKLWQEPYCLRAGLGIRGSYVGFPGTTVDMPILDALVGKKLRAYAAENGM